MIPAVQEGDAPRESGSALRTGGALRKALRWLRRHPGKSILYLCILLLLGELLSLPYVSIARLRKENPSGTALMTQRLNEAKAEGKKLRIVQRWVPIAKIPDHVVDAVIIAEDGTFYSHGGIDWFEVRESMKKDLREGRAARGASTITQQLAKNLFLSTSKDPVRKGREILIAFLLERLLSKQRILELYLNEIEWGRGIFGIEAASEAYFGKSAGDLTLDEGMRLAAVIPSPLRHKPIDDSRYVMRRRAILRARMEARNMILRSPTEEEISRIARQIQTRDSAGISGIPADTTGVNEDDDDGL